jgi:hypothetical protein
LKIPLILALLAGFESRMITLTNQPLDFASRHLLNAFGKVQKFVLIEKWEISV